MKLTTTFKLDLPQIIFLALFSDILLSTFNKSFSDKIEVKVKLETFPIFPGYFITQREFESPAVSGTRFSTILWGENRDGYIRKFYIILITLSFMYLNLW